MSIALWSVLIAGLLPLVAVGIAKFSGKTGGGYGPRANLNPRDWLALQDGVSKRATAAHLNSFEALPLFIAGVLVATMMKAPQATVDKNHKPTPSTVATNRPSYHAKSIARVKKQEVSTLLDDTRWKIMLNVGREPGK